MHNPISRTQTLCFILGLQGGTVHQVAETLQVSTDTIMYATEPEMQTLCRMAQKKVSHQYPTVLLFLGLCLDNLKIDYQGHEYPTWLRKAVDFYNMVKGIV